MKEEPTNAPPAPEKAKAAVPRENLATEYLSNERTFLAWVRTSIAVITLGFVVAKFGLWLGELAVSVSPDFNRIRTGASVPIGIGMMLFGGLLVVLAAWRYAVVNRQIERGAVTADHWLIALVTVLVVVLSLVMAAYLLLATARS